MKKKSEKNKSKMTLEGLARMVQAGFAETATKAQTVTKAELQNFREEVHEEFRLVKGRLDALEMELIEIKKKLNNIVYRHEFELLKDRIGVLEKKVGIRG